MFSQHGVNRVVTGYGVPVDDITATLTVGYHGPVLMQDVVFLDTLAHFDRERIPERVVHAKGAGEFGEGCRVHLHFPVVLETKPLTHNLVTNLNHLHPHANVTTCLGFILM
jgi:hypothetical protein